MPHKDARYLCIVVFYTCKNLKYSHLLSVISEDGSFLIAQIINQQKSIFDFHIVK